MRYPIRKRLVAEVEARMKQELPQFTRMPPEPKWAWQISPVLTLFILIQPFRQYDQFAVEIAWSNNQEFPWSKSGKIDITKPQGRDRYPCWRSTREKVWDLAPEATESIRDAGFQQYVDPPIEQVLPRIESSVDEAVQALKTEGIGFLRRVAESHQVSWPQLEE